MTKYDIIRRFHERPGYTRLVLKGVSLEKAQEHCLSPSSSSRTCGSGVGDDGPWFDSYIEARDYPRKPSVMLKAAIILTETR